MKIERTRNRENPRRPKAGEVLRATPEVEQPLEIDLQRVVDIIEKAKLEGPYRSDYEFLVGLVGGQYLEQLRPSHREEANEKWASLIDGKNKLLFELITVTAQSKLFDPTTFAKHQWNGDYIREKMTDELALIQTLASQTFAAQTWLIFLELVVLFPEEQQRIIDTLKPAVNSRLQYIRAQLIRDPQAVLWEDLVAIKMLFPENKEVQTVARAHWALWQRQVEGSLARGRAAETDDRRKTFFSAALGVSIGMYILAAEQAVITEEGLAEITPAQRKLTASPKLPDRPAV